MYDDERQSILSILKFLFFSFSAFIQAAIDLFLYVFVHFEE